jgi:hypothetical protein
MLSSLGVTWSDTLESLSAFFLWLFNSKEFWTGIIGAVVGGLMTLIAAISVQEQAAKNQRRRDLETERRRIKNLLQAIRAELTVLKTDNLDLLQTKLRERVERKSRVFPVAASDAPDETESFCRFRIKWGCVRNDRG